MKTSQTITTIAPALVLALSEIQTVKKDSKNPFLKNKYASLDAIIEASKPILAKHGLAALQMVNDDGIETIVMHTSGEWIGSDYLKIMSEVSKGLSSAQAVGVATTYAKRYQLGAMLNVSTEEDTDGQYGNNEGLKPDVKAGTSKPIPVIHPDNIAAINQIAKNVATGKYTVDAYRKTYTISKEVEVLINGEVQTIQEANNV